MAAAAAPTVRGYGPGAASSPSVPLPRPRSRAPASFVHVATRRARPVRLRTATAGGLQLQRREECASCYVLDTCRVRSSAGFCTHLCLARPQCFGDPVELQLCKAWLNRLAGRR